VTDFLPFRGLRYQPDVIGDVGDALAPPFDVIDAEGQAALDQRSPHNIIRLELGERRDSDTDTENQYSRAAVALQEWRASGAMALDKEPAFYVYTQEFEHEGKRRRRTQLLGRLRVEPWDAGVMLPHEETMSGPKKDRLALIKQLRTNLSAIFALYHDPEATVTDLLLQGEQLTDTQVDGQRHTLHAITDSATTKAISDALRERPLYMLDGHHRYETALNYRNERRDAADTWTGDEPENFAMVAITAVEDPGLVLLATHRLVRPPSVPSDIIARLERYFHVEDTTPKSFDGTAVLRLFARLTAAGQSGIAFGAIGLEEGRLHLLTLKDQDAVRELMPDGTDIWKSMDVNVLEYAVLRETLNVSSGSLDDVFYTEDVQQAHREVESGKWPLAFLLNPTPVEEMLAVADAGEKTPPKATYFYPKLATGLVINPHE
jgi:uncharacterized protein (DUF1015 family)